MQMFDPWRGAAFYYDASTRRVGIPDGFSGEIDWRDAPDGSVPPDVFPGKD